MLLYEIASRMSFVSEFVKKATSYKADRNRKLPIVNVLGSY